jgi:osmotically inducible protein OsmC
MADFRRKASAVWNGDLRNGIGRMSTHSGALKDMRYSFNQRFGDEPGTNPEELLAAAHASCYSMALSGALSSKGYTVESVETNATCFLSPQASGGFRITKMHLQVRGKVKGIDEATFVEIAKETDAGGCPVSILLHPGLTIELDAALVK